MNRDGVSAVPAGARESAYRRFWAHVGSTFPDLGGAASTRYYADNERRLFLEHFPALAGLTILKTDLWDEARNTRILAWAGERGARAYGIDISAPTVLQARAAFARTALHCAVSDVRDLPFRDGSFDAIYSMGTIEHFDETERAVAEMARVLKPGGTAIIGVPNRHDPFLRPLLAAVLQRLGLYAYGYENRLPPCTASHARGCWPDCARRDGDSLHAGVAQDARPRLSQLVRAPVSDDSGVRSAICVARSSRAGSTPAWLPAGYGRDKAAAVDTTGRVGNTGRWARRRLRDGLPSTTGWEGPLSRRSTNPSRTRPRDSDRRRRGLPVSGGSPLWCNSHRA